MQGSRICPAHAQWLPKPEGLPPHHRYRTGLPSFAVIPPVRSINRELAAGNP